MEFTVRVGCDLASIRDVGRTLDLYGDRYLERVFGMALDTIEARPHPRTLAGRFAAKEALAKAIGIGDRPFSWSDVLVAAGRDGRPTIELFGAAAEYARELGATGFDVSVTHEGDFAMAVVTCVTGRVADSTAVGATVAKVALTAVDAELWTTSGGLLNEIESKVRGAVAAGLGEKLDLSTLGLADDLFAAGMTSHQTVQVMLSLEDEFDIEFPDEILTRSTFSSIDSIVRAVVGLT